MSRHSKNNTSGKFTYHQRQQLKEYGTQKARLGKDSLKSFDSCSICLNDLINPLSCSKGHLYCKECIYTSLLNQKQQIKEKEELWKQQQDKLKQKEEVIKAKKAEEELKQFESNNVTFLQHKKDETLDKDKEKDKDKDNSSESNKDLVKEKDLELKCYWTFTHESKDAVYEKPDSNTMCPEGGHPLRVKQLIAVKFKSAEMDGGKDVNKYACPICDKILTNTTKLKMLKRCGHVFCENCIKRFQDDSKNLKTSQCYVCSKDYESLDIINLQQGGTGYAGQSGHKLEASKYNVTAVI